jgi:hypothetical protein
MCRGRALMLPIVTIFADADQMIPEPADRRALVERFLRMARGREHKIMHFEVANESWQNGFGGPEGVEQIRAIARDLATRTDIPVAISGSDGHDCADHLVLYEGVPVEILTEHFARDVRGPLRAWQPVVEPWRLRECKGLRPVVSSNEPIGPGSSVASDSDPFRIVAAALVAYMSGAGLYVLHTDAGVRGLDPLLAMPDAAAILAGLKAMKGYVPADLPKWSHHRHDTPGHPFVVFSGPKRETVRTEPADDGPLEVFASVRATGRPVESISSEAEPAGWPATTMSNDSDSVAPAGVANAATVTQSRTPPPA